MRDGPYRQPATPREVGPARPPALVRAVTLAVAGVLLLFLVAPVVALAMQPFSFYATLVTGSLAAWTAIALIRIGCTAA